MAERKKRKITVGETKTPFTKIELNKNVEDDDSVEDPEDPDEHPPMISKTGR